MVKKNNIEGKNTIMNSKREHLEHTNSEAWGNTSTTCTCITKQNKAGLKILTYLQILLEQRHISKVRQ